MNQKNWFQIILVLVLIGLAKGALHIVRIVILAGLGLAGMWMLHTLAQDYNQLSNKFPFNFAQISTPNMKGKRSVDYLDKDVDIPGFPDLKWDVILKEDPEGCVLSFICQLASVPYKELKFPERNILKLIRSSKERDTRSSKSIRTALNLGETLKDAEKCRNRYPSCPYSSDAIIALLNTYGGKR